MSSYLNVMTPCQILSITMETNLMSCGCFTIFGELLVFNNNALKRSKASINEHYVILIAIPSFFSTGTHSRGTWQMDTNWWRDLGKNHCFWAKSSCGKSLCTSSCADSQRYWWRLWWHEVSLKCEMNNWTRDKHQINIWVIFKNIL